MNKKLFIICTLLFFHSIFCYSTIKVNNHIIGYKINTFELIINKFCELNNINNITVNVEFTDEQDGRTIKENDSTYIVRINTRELDEFDSKKILVHELIHLNQYYTKRLVVKSDCVVFEGKEYPLDMNYLSRPWEKEAFSQSKKLVRGILNQI